MAVAKIKRILIQKRFRTHAESMAAPELICDELRAGHYIIITRVNRQYYERKLCVIYIPRSVSLTCLKWEFNQRNKNDKKE